MDLFILLYGSTIIGFLVGLVLAVNHRERRSKQLKAAKGEVAALIKGREGELQRLADEIISVFERHDYKVIERSDTEIAFRYPPLFDDGVAVGAYWIIAVISLGGTVAAYLAALLFGGFSQRITMRLV